jgi:outer membrane protein assembly factor BamA
MAKLKLLFSAFFFLTLLCAHAQSYPVQFIGADADSTELQQKAALTTTFPTRGDASVYLSRLPSLLQSKGYITAAIDSLQLDSARAKVYLFLGDQYKWAKIQTPAPYADLLEAIHWNEKTFNGTVDFSTLQAWQKKILDYLEEIGHPFGKVYLDSIGIHNEEVTAVLKIEKGPLYKIDSIRVHGDVKVNTLFLQRYLDIPNGSIYNRKKLSDISKKLSELGYLQEERSSDLSLLGTGSILNIYLKPKRSSQINALVGFQPNSSPLPGINRKLLLTVDANILLRNALGSGETIGLLWQQLQQSSPRLNLLFEQPYIFRSSFGLTFSLDMYKQDSSYLNLNMNLGTSYRISERQTGTLFLQRRQSLVNSVNTALVLQTRQLPREADVSSLNLGISYSFNSTDYRFNPRRGNELLVVSTAGTKTIKKNAQILELQDPAEPSFKFEHLYDTIKPKVYQFRITAAAAHYIPLGRQSTVKLGVNAGLYQSANYFRNELFQIGGYKLLRGFDEASQFVSKYAVGTLEYRYLVGLNSAFFAFLDGGYGKHLQEINPDHTYLGTGLGLSFETKAGLINLAWAVGKRNDLDFNLRQSKVHLGFSSFF